MLKGLEIVFRGIEHSAAIERAVRNKIQKLEQFSDKIRGCRVVIDRPHNRHTKGTIYHVSLDVSLPNMDINVHNDQHDNHAHEDLYIAIRDAFNAAKRKLISFNNKKSRNFRHTQIEAA